MADDSGDLELRALWWFQNVQSRVHRL